MNRRTVCYLRITAQAGDLHFSVFCTRHSLECRRMEVFRWIERLAGQLHWRTYELTISGASSMEANERKHALFENRYPAS
ncbi:hypothetical protein ACUNV4_23815 [Granulosicoccus sp. 3-233]|uniref:hypothetical protein n=1 Tax=Granulosicoccus sp. 3-233 TaxID=3417969 RepID=UPI003D34FBC3